MKIIIAIFTCLLAAIVIPVIQSGNPVFPGWYADPEGIIYNNKYWIYPTFSADWGEQTFFDAFSSSDLVNWTKHPRIIDNVEVTWARGAMWAPAVLAKDDKYYFFFSANDVHSPNDLGGIGVGVADRPEGPYRDPIGAPLVRSIVFGAIPIDQYVFKDVDGSYYMYYGGGGHCNMVRLNDSLTAVIPHADGALCKEITPEGYVEGPFMFMRNGTYYFMWSEGAWTGPDYKVAYAMASSPYGPFVRLDTILEQDASIGTGAGHHSVIHVEEEDKYFIVYHRRPLNETAINHRVTCVDEMHFDENGRIRKVSITNEGVYHPLS